jgi:hypothetical protein
MSDTIGVIGQMYVDRKSNKTGTLLDRDAENKKLSFLDANGEPFQVSYAAFKSNWRKVIHETPTPTEPADETVVEQTPEQTIIPAVLETEDDKIKNFVTTLAGCRVAYVEVTPTDANVVVDDVTVCTMHKVDGGYKMIMLPDIFIFTDWHDTFRAGDVHFNIKHGRHLGVLVDCVRASLGDILQFIKTAAVEINLYGYID